MAEPLKIALDFDDCYTRDPVLFTEFINYARERGHEVHIVTMRQADDKPELEALISSATSIHTTNLNAKRPFMEDRGIDIDIWIDDRPEYVNEAHRNLTEYRTGQIERRVIPELTHS